MLCRCAICFLLVLPGCGQGVDSVDGISRKGSGSVDAKSLVRIGDTITMGNLEISPVAAEIRKASGKTMGIRGEDFETDEEVLVLTLEVKNISEGRVFRPLIYSGKVTDSFGNEMSRPFDSFTLYLIEDCKSREDIQPGETVIIRDMRQLRLKTAKSFTWQMRLNGGEEDAAEFTIGIEI